MAIEQLYHKQETAKEYTKKYTLESTDDMVVKQEDGMLGYISAGQFATTGSNIFDGGQIIDGNLTIIGDIYANEFLVTTSSTEHFTASTNFGLDSGDIHSFTGSVKITGSLDVIGATTTLGNTIMTGLLLVNGSTTQIGNNTLLGNTILSGSVGISGSTIQQGNTTIIGNTTMTGSNGIFGNTAMSGSLSVSGSTTIKGNTTIAGNLVLTGSVQVSGSFTGSMQFDGDLNLSSPHGFYRWGNKLFNYINLYNTGSIPLTSGSATALTYTSDLTEGFVFESGSHIRALNTGYYNVQFSVQLQKPGTGPAEVDIWLSKNNQNIPYTDSSFTLPFKANLIAALNFFVPLTAGDYIELKATSNDSTVSANTIPANGIRPASPSVVVTISQIA
jgi:cytoskeletal protein CcmA (bactofilin family)